MSASIKEMVDKKIAGKKVMVFLKPSCPFCQQAMSVLKQYNLGPDELEVMEIDSHPECGAIQDYLKELTGARTVPRVFINGKCIGGGSETSAAHASGKLKELLGK